MIQPLLMMGWACGLLIVSPTSDQKGRRAIFIKMTMLQLAVNITCLVFIGTQQQLDNSNQFIFMFLLFLLGVARANNMVGLVLLVEHFPKRYTTLICTIRNVGEPLLYAGWLLYFSVWNTPPKFYFYPVFWISLFVPCLYVGNKIIQESPYWLMSKGYFKKLLLYFQYISKFNRAEQKFNNYYELNKSQFDNDIELADQEDYGSSREDSFSGQIRNNKIVRKNFIIMTIFWTTCSVMYYMFILEMRDFVQYSENQILWYLWSTLSEIAGTICGGLMVTYFRARKSLFISYGLVAFGSLFLVIFSKNQFGPEIDKLKVQIRVGMSLILKFALSAAFNTLYCVNFEFPTNIASQTIGVPNTVARFLTVVSVMLVSAGDSSQSTSIQLVCLVLAAISACLTIFLDMNLNNTEISKRDNFTLRLGPSSQLRK